MIRVRCYYKESSVIKQLRIQPYEGLSGGFNQAGQRPYTIHVFWEGQTTIDTMTKSDVEALTRTITYTLARVLHPDGQLLVSPELQVKLGLVR